MTSPIVDDYIKYLRAIVKAKTSDTRQRNARSARAALGIMTAKAAQQAADRVVVERLLRAEGYLFGHPLKGRN